MTNTISRIRPVRRTGRNRRRGATAVEFAFAAPALFIVIFVCAEFSRMSLMRNLAHNAAYESARAVIVEGANENDAIAVANAVIGRVGARNAQINVNNGESIDFDTDVVTVEITIPMEDNSFFFGSFYEGREIRATVSLNTERYTGYFNADEVAGSGN